MAAPAQEVRTGVGGSTSPLGPDSTWGDADLNGSKMEARLAQLELKLIKDNEERFSKMEDNLTTLMETYYKNLQSSPGQSVEISDNNSDKTYQLLERYLPVLENSLNLDKALKEMKEKLDLLLGGENEANKLIDNIAPNVDKVKSDMKKMEKEIYHKMDKIYDEAKKIREDQKLDQKKLDDTLHNSKRIREDQSEKFKRFESKLDELKSSTGNKRERSRSESSEHRRSRSRKRGRGNSRETSISSLNRSKTELEIEKKLSKVEENVGVISTSVADLRKDFGQRKEFEDQMLSNIIKVASLLQSQESMENSIKIPVAPSRWEDDDRSPSPPGKRMSRSPVKLPKQLKEKSKKKKKVRSDSSSSSSSEERSSNRNQKKSDIIDIKSMEVIVAKVSSIEEKFRETFKNLKKSHVKIEENSKNTLDRVGEMTVGVQVIAENLDSVNDVARKVDILENIDANMVKLDQLEKLDRIWEEVTSTRSLMTLQQQQQTRQQLSQPRLPPPLSLGLDDGDWDEPRPPPTMSPMPAPGPNTQQVGEIVKLSMEERFCEFTGLIEDLSDKLSRKIDNVSGNRHEDDVPDFRRRLKRLEDAQFVKSECPNSPGQSIMTPPAQASLMQSSPMSDFRASQLERKISEISPKLDDLYIRVLPILNDIKTTQRQEVGKENNIVKEVQYCQGKIEKLADAFEDYVEDRRSDRGPGSLDRRINSAIEMEPVINKLGSIESGISRHQTTVGDCLNALVEMRTFTAKQASLDKIERMLGQKESSGELPFGGSDGENLGRLERRINTQLDFLKKQEKSLERFMKNSDQDAKLLSQCNTAIQGMKSAVTANGREVLLGITSLGDQLRNVEVSLGEVKTDMSGLGGSLDEIGGQVNNIDRNAVCSGEEAIAKIQSGLEKLASTVRSLEKSGRSSSSSVSRRKSTEKEDSPVNVMDVFANNDVKNTLDEINNNTGKLQEELKAAVLGLKSEVRKTDTNVGKAIKNLFNLLNSTVDLQKQTNVSLSEVEANIKSSIDNVVTEVRDQGLNNSDGTKHNDGAPTLETATKIETIGNRLDKLYKIVTRVKFLLEDGSDDEDGKKKKRHSTDGANYDFGELEKLLIEVSSKIDNTSLSSVSSRLDCIDDKIDKMYRGSSDKKIDDLSFKISEMEDSISRRIEDDLSSNVEKVDRMTELVQEVKNIVQETGDRMITTKTFNNNLTDMRKQILNLQNSISNIPDEFGSQAAAMEENLCSNVESSVREVFKSHWEELMNEIDQILGKLSTIKRFVKFRSREGSVEGDETEQPTLESVMTRISDLADKINVVHNALENGILDAGPDTGSRKESLGNALILEEIRKKVDNETFNKHQKEMYTTVHNVQNRLLEEQMRMITNLSGTRKDSSQPTMVTLIECLNKVRESQNLIVSSHNLGFTSQTSTNKILADVVTNLENTHGLLDRFRDGGAGVKATSRLSEICDDLGSAVTGLISAQDQLANCTTNNMQQLDKLIKSACTIMREDTWNSKKRLSVAADAGPAAKRRTGGGGVRMVVSVRESEVNQEDSCGAASPASETHEDWDTPEVRLPTVNLRNAILSPRQREALRQSIETRDDDDATEVKDEFASPEKN